MKIFCVGRNYADHAKELKNDIPVSPVIFMKPQTAHLKHISNFYYPEFTNELHYEAELVLRISKNGKNIKKTFAAQYFNAITIGIDFTARDIQQELKSKGLPWEKAKSWDNSAVTGRWLELDPQMLNNPILFSLYKNDQVVQQGNSADMIFSFETVIADISRYFSVNISDLIFTGTPAGVGECVIGDILTGYIEDKKLFELEVK